MQLNPVPPEVAHAGMRGLKTIALADGELHALERRMLEGVQRHLLHSSFDVDALEPIAPSQLAEAVASAELRERLLAGFTVMALIDGEPSRVEADLLDDCARAFGVTRHAYANVRRLIDHQLLVTRIDIARRSFLGQRGRSYLAEHGVRGFARTLRSLVGIENPALAARYQALEHTPRGTLGREYFEFVRANGFALPGEQDAAPEIVVFHDCLHVLAEYDTNSLEETQIASFQAGVLKKDSVYGLLFMLSQFHLGVQMTPVTGAEKMVADPMRMLEAFARGCKVNRDLCVDWRPADDFHRSVVELRREFAIEPRTKGSRPSNTCPPG